MNQLSHLTDEQLYDLLDPTLDQAPDADTHLHLLDCAGCRTEFTSLRASLVNFRAAATNVAAATAPTSRPMSSSLRTYSSRPRIWAASLAMATMLMAVSVAVIHPGTTPPIKNASTVETPQVVPAATESDEALLDGIQRDLSTPIPPSLEPLTVPAASGDISTKD